MGRDDRYPVARPFFMPGFRNPRMDPGFQLVPQSSHRAPAWKFAFRKELAIAITEAVGGTG